MTEPQTENIPIKQRIFTRRTFLPWLILAVFGLGLFLVRKWIWGRVYPAVPKYARTTPRFLAPRTTKPVQRSEGFYLNPKSGIIHYVPEGKRLLFTVGLDAERLAVVDPTNLNIAPSNPKVKRTRINISRASYSFERTAVSAFKRNDFDKGIALLMQAIQTELQSGRRPSWVPSFRLYDLLAAVSVRFDRPDDLKRMIDTVKSSKDPLIVQKFDNRLKNWQDPQSRWHRRWTNRSKQVKWTVDEFSGLVLLM